MTPWIDWYNSLAKPSWTPAPGTIGLIWQILYPVILLVWGTIIWAAVAVWKHHPWVAIAQLPYFLWVSIATVLQIWITAANRGL
jgi:tryptophan-rich sensory protein